MIKLLVGLALCCATTMASTTATELLEEEPSEHIVEEIPILIATFVLMIDILFQNKAAVVARRPDWEPFKELLIIRGLWYRMVRMRPGTFDKLLDLIQQDLHIDEAQAN